MPTDYDKYRKEIEAIAGTRPSAPEPITPPAPVIPAQPVARVGLERNIPKDVMTSLVKGGISTAQAAGGLVDLIPGIKLGKSLDNAGFSFADMQQRMSQDYSPAQQAAFKQWEDAKGIRESVGSLLSNPSVAMHAAVESLPLSFAGGGIIGRGIMKAAPAITRGMAAALGEGAITAGALNEGIRSETPEKETSLGQKAMAIGGGAITSLISGAGARFASKRGLANIDELGMAPETALNKTLEKIGSKIKNPGVVRRIIEGGGTEFFEELTQEGQEQVWQNAALDKPLLEDVPKSMLLGGAAGGITGGVYNIRPDEVKTHVPTPTKGDRDAFIAASVSQNMPGDSIKLLRASPQAREQWGLSEADIDYIEQLQKHPTIQQAYATINSAPTESAKQGMQAYLFNWVKQQQADLGVKKPEAEVQPAETEELKSIGHKAKPAEKLSVKALEKRLEKLEKKREELTELQKLDPENTDALGQLKTVDRLKRVTETTLAKKTKEKKHADIDIMTQDLASLTFERQKLESTESLTKEETKRLSAVHKEIDERMEQIRQLAQDSSEESRAKDRKSKVLASVPINDAIEGDKTAARAGVMYTNMPDEELDKNIADATETINVLSKVVSTTPEERVALSDAKTRLKEFTHTKKQREVDAAAALVKEKEQEKSTIGKAAPEVRSKLKSLGYSDKDVDNMPVETARNAAALNILVKKLEPAIDGTRPMATPKRDKKGRSYSEKPLPEQSARIFEAIKAGTVVKDWDEKQSVSFGNETLKVTPAHIKALKARGLVDTEQDTKNLIPLDPNVRTTEIAKNELVKVASEIGPIKHEAVEGFHRSTDPERLEKGIEPSDDTFRIVRDPASLTTAQAQADEMATKFKTGAPATKETSGQQQDFNVTFEGTIVDYNNPKTKRFIDKLLVNLANEGSGLPVEHAVYEQLRKYGIDAVDNFNGIRGGTELHILNTKGLKVGKPFVAPKVKKVAKVAKAPKVELSPEDQLKANVARTAGTIKAFQTNISLLEEDYADMSADKKAGPKGKEIQAKIENIKKAIAGLEAQNTQAANTLKLAGKTEPKKVEPKKVEPKKAESKTQSLNVLQAQLAALKATRAEYRKKLATGPEDAKEIKAKVEALNEKINATLAAINRASITPDVKTKKSKTAKAKAKAAAKPVMPTTPKKDLDLVDIQAKINKIKDQIAAAKAKFESTDKLAHQLKLLKESLESKLAESKEAPPKKPAAPKKPTPKEKDEALRKVNLANPTMSTAQQRAVKYLASGKTIKMAEGKKVHPSSETGLSTLKALEKKGIVKRAIDGTYSLADAFTSEGEVQQSLAEDEFLKVNKDTRGIFSLGVGVQNTISKAAAIITKLPAFKQWFKKSVVINKEGKPLVVYHGTRRNYAKDYKFKEFETRPVYTDYSTKKPVVRLKGAWFASNPVYPSRIGGSHTRAFFLSMQNPLDLRELGEDSVTKDINKLFKERGLTPLENEWPGEKDYENWEDHSHEMFWLIRDYFEEAEALGYDGIIIREANSDSYVVFKPNQIKSLYNKGTFSEEKDDVYQSVQEIDSEGYITAHDAEQAVKGWTAHWRYSGNIHVVKDVSQLPGNVAKSLSVKSRKTRGCYIDKTGDIFIVSDNNPTYKKLFENLMHEAFGHHGIRMMPANLINPFLDQIWKDKQDTDRMRFINEHYAHVAKAKTAEERVLAQRRSAEEWIANEATIAEEATWKDRLIALVQRWLRSMGINFKVTDAEIKTWLSNMRQAVVRGDERLWTKHGVEAMFAGPKATGYKQAEKEGRLLSSPYDKVPRFWIDDSNIRMKSWDGFRNVKGDATTTLGELIQHKELFKNYPKFKNIQVVATTFKTGKSEGEGTVFETEGQSGARDGKPTIWLNKYLSVEEVAGVLLHEIQHQIQNKERFIYGIHQSLWMLCVQYDRLAKAVKRFKPTKLPKIDRFRKYLPYVWQEHVYAPQDSPAIVLSETEKQEYTKLLSSVYNLYWSFIPGEIEASEVERVYIANRPQFVNKHEHRKDQLRRYAKEYVAGNKAVSFNLSLLLNHFLNDNLDYENKPALLARYAREIVGGRFKSKIEDLTTEPNENYDKPYGVPMPPRALTMSHKGTNINWLTHVAPMLSPKIVDEYLENSNIELQLSEEESTWVALTKQPKTAQEAQAAQEADLKQINNIIATKFKDPAVKKIANLFGRIFKALPENIDQPVRDANTQTTNFFTRILSSPEFYFTRSSAAAKVMAHAINQTQLKFETLHGLTGESLNTIEQISQTDPESYDKGGEYLRSIDESGVGYGLQFKGKKWHVLTPKRNIIYSFESEKLAVAKMVEEEGKHVKSLGYSDNVVRMVKEWRQFTNRCFDTQVAEMRKQIKRSKDNDLPEPTVVFTNEKGQEREVIPMSVAIALMGDRRGTYFPRERPSRQYVLIADAGGPTGKKELIPISAYLPPNTLNGPVKTWLKQAINSALPVSKEVQKLKDKGFTDDQISIRLVNRPSESTFDAPGSVTAIDTILKLAEEKVLNDDNITQTEIDLLNAMSQRISLAVGDIYKQKGALKSRMARAAEHWEGYESDPLKAASAHAQRLAAGISRRTTTRGMLEAFTGRDVSFKEYQKEHPNAQYKEYRQYVRDKAVHPVKQRQLYDDLRTYMTHVSRPDTKVDRFVGYLKGLAVLKFLGLRASSAVINLTGLMTAGPATLSTHANISLLQATKFIAEAIPKYLSYRAHVMQKKGLLSSAMKAMFKPGKLTAEDIAIFDEITAKGLDEAQFNRETMRQLQSKAGDFWNSLMSFAMMFFGATERLNRAVTIHAAQRALKMKDPNLTQQSLLDKSIFISNRTHGIYGKEAKPWLVQKVPFLDLPYTFFKYQQTYLLNAWEQGVTFGNVKNAMFMLLAPAVLAGAGTSVFTPAASAVASVIMRSFRIKGADDPEEALYEWAEKTLGSDAFFRNGFAGLANINLKGSLQINAPLPDLSDGYVGLMGAPGAVFTDIIKGFVETEKYGWVKGMESFMPTAISSIMKGHREYTEGVSGKDYSPIFFGEGRLKGSAMDFAMRSIAFNPAHISGRREKQWRENQVRLNYQKDRSLVLDRLKKLLTQGPENATVEGYAELYKTIDEYNNRAATADPKYYVPMITSKWLNTQIKRIATPDKYERLREI